MTEKILTELNIRTYMHLDMENAVVRWITRDHNYRVRGLYDKLAEKTDWVLCEMTKWR